MLEPRRPAGPGRGPARRLGPALPAARGPGPAPHGPGLRRRGLRPPAVRRAPRSVPPGRLRGGSVTERHAQPQHGPAVRGGASRSRWGCSGYNVARSTSRSRSRTMLILFVSLAGLAYPIAEWLRLRRAIRQANRSAGGDLRVPRAEARAAPERRRPFPEPRSRSRSRLENVTLESRSGPRPARRRLGRDPRRAAHGHHGTGRGFQAGPGLPDPPADRPASPAGSGSTAVTSAR